MYFEVALNLREFNYTHHTKRKEKQTQKYFKKCK